MASALAQERFAGARRFELGHRHLGEVGGRQRQLEQRRLRRPFDGPKVRRKIVNVLGHTFGDPERIRTSDQEFRKLLLYPC